MNKIRVMEMNKRPVVIVVIKDRGLVYLKEFRLSR